MLQAMFPFICWFPGLLLIFFLFLVHGFLFLYFCLFLLFTFTWFMVPGFESFVSFYDCAPCCFMEFMLHFLFGISCPLALLGLYYSSSKEILPRFYIFGCHLFYPSIGLFSLVQQPTLIFKSRPLSFGEYLPLFFLIFFFIINVIRFARIFWIWTL